MIQSRVRLALFVVLCAVVLLPRLGGPHLHFCLDGSAPAMAFHLSNGDSGESISGTDDGHQDQTVDVTKPVLGKVWPPGFDGGLFLILVLFLVRSRQNVLLPVLRTIALPALPLFLRPPLRGPPA